MGGQAGSSNSRRTGHSQGHGVAAELLHQVVVALMDTIQLGLDGRGDSHAV